MKATHGTFAETAQKTQNQITYKAIVNQPLRNYATNAKQNKQTTTVNNLPFLL
jgi:hypothetical protein